MPELTIDQAIQIAKNECKDPYAQTYLKAIPKAIELGGAMENATAKQGLKTQLLYALSNMSYWRGQNARECKKVLKKFANS